MLASHKGEIPFVVFLIPFLAGIALALSFNLTGYKLALVIVFSVLSTGFIGLNICYEQVRLYRRQWVSGVMLLVLILLSGMIGVINFDNRNHSSYFEKRPADVLLVKVSNEPQFKNGYLRFTADAKLSNYKGINTIVSGAVLLILHADNVYASKISYGDELVIPAKYTAIDPPFNPAEFNYKQYLAQQNIYAQEFLNLHDIRVIKRNAGNPLVSYSLKLRQKLVNQFKRYLYSKEAIAVASTLILGYKAELDNDILQAYSKTGTIHVLSVSGAHVAIIFTLINMLLGFLDRYKYGRLFKAIFTILLIWYYSLLTGLSPAVCRAAVMISLIIIGKTYNRYINTLNILAISAFIILLFNPFLISDVGFQLSYLAVAGLVVFQPIVYNWLDVQNKWLDKLWLLCSVSIAAQAITFPLSAYYFHQFPVYFLLSNLFILLPSFVIMYAGIGFLLSAQLGLIFLAKPLGYILKQSVLIMDNGLQFIEHAPYASLGKLWITRTEYLLLFLIVILLFCLFYYKRSVFIHITLACLLLLAISLSTKRIEGIRTNQITFFNLKKHTAILFKQGNRAVVLTDLKDTDKTYRYSIQPCLDSNLINSISIISFAKNISTPFFRKSGNLIRFIDKNMLVYDKTLLGGQIAPKFNADYIFITGNPRNNLTAIDNNYHYQTLIVDAGNSDKFIGGLKIKGVNKYKKVYVLKRNKSLVLQSD